jgi:hypothetical protein
MATARHGIRADPPVYRASIDARYTHVRGSDRYHDGCWGKWLSLYVKVGTPPRWLRFGRWCGRCNLVLVDPPIRDEVEAARGRE